MKRIAIAPGDPAGIGYEITAKALAQCLAQPDWPRDTVAVVYADQGLMQRAFEQFAPASLRWISDVGEAVSSGVIYLASPGEGVRAGDFVPGAIQAQTAVCAHKALMRICDDIKRQRIHGICTGPIHKGAMRMAGIPEIGHTEMLAQALGCPNPLTLFITRGLRIFFYSRHLSLRQAIDAIQTDRLVEFGLEMHRQMRQLGFDRPHLAMAALNPHGSDGGQFGDEEARLIQPASARLRDLGVDISDPIGADSVFAQAAGGQFDAVLSLYHDQGHIAAKTYDFERTISATLGLPCLRTSVDHGTALDIAWQGKAQAISMMTAIQALMQYLPKD